MDFRTFHNADPPQLAALWQKSEPETGLCRGMNPSLMEDLVFSKRYFDHAGLIVAEQDGQICGFAHAGLGLNKERTALCHERGVISMLVVDPARRRQGIGKQLFQRAEQFLAAKGVTTIQLGEWGRLSPFYTGLYGPSLCPGILNTSPAVEFCQAMGFKAQFETCVLELDLSRFRQPVDRKLLQVRRGVEVSYNYDPVPNDWWEASRFGVMERVLFELAPKGGGPSQVQALFWYHEPNYRGRNAGAGLVHITAEPEARRLGWGTFLLSEALKHLHGSGFQSVSALCRATNQPIQGLLKKLGFREVNRGTVYRKRLAKPLDALNSA